MQLRLFRFRHLLRMLIFAGLAFFLFVVGFIVFIAANAGKGEEDLRRLMEDDREAKRNPEVGNYVAADGTDADGHFSAEDKKIELDFAPPILYPYGLDERGEVPDIQPDAPVDPAP